MGYSRVFIFMILCYGWIFYEIAEKIKIYRELRQEAQDQESSFFKDFHRWLYFTFNLRAFPKYMNIERTH